MHKFIQVVRGIVSILLLVELGLLALFVGTSGVVIMIALFVRLCTWVWPW